MKPEERFKKLQAAVMMMFDFPTKEDVEMMLDVTRTLEGLPEADRASHLAVLEALLETWEE